MKILYGTVIALASISVLCAMDDNVTKQTSGMLLSGRSRAISLSTSSLSSSYASSTVTYSKPELPALNCEALVKQDFSTDQSPHLIFSPRVSSPHPHVEHVASIKDYSDRKLSSSSLPLIPEKK